MNQHEFIRGCLLFYEQEGLTPDNSWEKAHYPAPNGKGNDVVYLTHDHHQIQGLLQSEEYGQCCFFNGDAKKFLTCGPFITGWFKLWDLYDNWAGDSIKKLLSEKDEEGKSIHARQMGKKSMETRRSAMTEEEIKDYYTGLAQKAHQEKNQDGKSVLGKINGKRINEIIHSEVDENGKSKHALRCNEIIHSKKDEKGRSLVAMKTSSQKWKCLITGHVSTPGPLSLYQRARGIDPKLRVRLS